MAKVSMIVAIYGAVLATITAAVQITNALKDRIRVKVAIHRNMVIMPPDSTKYGKKQLIVISATNNGRRPVLVTGISAMRLFPERTAFLLLDIQPQPPCELTEGKYLQAFIPEEEFDMNGISHFVVATSTGRRFRANHAKWYKRGWSSIMLKLKGSDKTKLAAKSAGR